jgi:hypothetical protein
LVSHDSRHQLCAHHTDCKSCLSEKGIAVECLDKNCEYSFDLCFDCGEIQNNSPFPIFLEEQSEKQPHPKPNIFLPIPNPSSSIFIENTTKNNT